jgi:uncharacterized membrane protein
MSTKRDWATLLGVASAGLALPAVAAAGPIARLIGIDETSRNRLIIRLVGAREAAAAAALLGMPRRWMLWARVAGDALDLSLLGAGISHQLRAGRPPGRTVRTAAATGVVAAITAVDVVAAGGGSHAASPVGTTGNVTITKPADEVYRYWRQLDRLPEFMTHLDSVRTDGDGRSLWRATAPFGKQVEWEAEVVSDVPSQELAWRSVPGAPVTSEGKVTFRRSPAGGTEVRVTMAYRGTGKVGRAVARWAGEEPRQMLDDDLRRFKQVMETGEVIRSDGAIEGKTARAEFPQRPAQPRKEIS